MFRLRILLYTFVNELKKETYLWLFWKSMV